MTASRPRQHPSQPSSRPAPAVQLLLELAQQRLAEGGKIARVAGGDDDAAGGSNSIDAKFAVYTAVGAVFGLMLAITAVIATAVAITANGGSLDLSNSDLWRPLAGGQALGRLPGAPDISQWAGGLLLAGYAVVFAAIVLTTSVRRDIT